MHALRIYHKNAFAIWNLEHRNNLIEVALRDGKFTYCRSHIFNPLTTYYVFWCCLTLSVCYQLVQSVLKTGFVLAKKVLIGGGGWVSMGGCLGSGANTNLCKYHSPTLVGAPFLGL